MRKIIKSKKDSQYIRHEKISLMCSNCYNLYPIEIRHTDSISIKSKYSISALNSDYLVFEKKRCNFCNIEDPNLIELDYEIAEIISLLNKKGVETIYCCSGHDEKDFESAPYISFNKKNKDYIISIINNLKYWYYDENFLEISIDNNVEVIRCNIENKEEGLKELKDYLVKNI